MSLALSKTVIEELTLSLIRSTCEGLHHYMLSHPVDLTRSVTTLIIAFLKKKYLLKETLLDFFHFPPHLSHFHDYHTTGQFVFAIFASPHNPGMAFSLWGFLMLPGLCCWVSLSTCMHSFGHSNCSKAPSGMDTATFTLHLSKDSMISNHHNIISEDSEMNNKMATSFKTIDR